MSDEKSGPDRHPSRRRVLAVGLAAAALQVAPTRRAGAQALVGTSAWSGSDHARVRLIDAGAPAGTASERLVGIQVELDPGYLTYWRSPGEAGVPPTVSFAGSTGLKSATLLFPAPGRFSEDGVEAIGYKDGVVFPVRVVPAEAAVPVVLAMTLAFGICERLCLPASAAASLKLDGTGQSPEADLVRDALAHVPTPSRLGAAGPQAIMAVVGHAGDPTLSVLVHTTATEVPVLFAEAADPWFVRAGEGLWSSDGLLRYGLTVEGSPPVPAALPLRLTLVGSDGSIEVPVTLDAPAPKP